MRPILPESIRSCYWFSFPIIRHIRYYLSEFRDRNRWNCVAIPFFPIRIPLCTEKWLPQLWDNKHKSRNRLHKRDVSEIQLKSTRPNISPFFVFYLFVAWHIDSESVDMVGFSCHILSRLILSASQLLSSTTLNPRSWKLKLRTKDPPMLVLDQLGWMPKPIELGVPHRLCT